MSLHQLTCRNPNCPKNGVTEPHEINPNYPTSAICGECGLEIVDVEPPFPTF